MKKNSFLILIICVFFISCSNELSDTEELQGIEFLEDTIQIDYLSVKPLSVLPKPIGAELPKILFDSRNRYVAHILPDNKVLGMKAGTTLLTAKTADGSFSAECQIKVNPTNFLYDEPYLIFRGSESEIMAYEKRAFAGVVNYNPYLRVLGFWGENSSVDCVFYFIRNDRFIHAEVYMHKTEIMKQNIMGFIEQRYYYRDVNYGIIEYEGEKKRVGIKEREDDFQIIYVNSSSLLEPILLDDEIDELKNEIFFNKKNIFIEKS